jgi:hypothetical protein
MEMDDNLKRLMKDLGAAINESLSESESVSGAISDIRDAGYDVFLILEATIGFHRRNQDQSEQALGPQVVSGDLVLNSQDTQFLKSLRITLGGSNDLFPRKD